MPFSTVRRSDGDKLEDLASVLARSNRVVVITGAGVSTSCGIPDFRSQHGLYSLMEAAHAEGISKGRQIKGADLFNSNLFRDQDQTATFYRFIASLRQKCRSTSRTSMAHKLIRKLRDRQKLVRCYTQNIDGFEAREGLCADLSRGAGNRNRLAKKALSTAKTPFSAAAGGVHDAGCEVVPLHGGMEALRCSVCSSQPPWSPEAQSSFLRGDAPTCPECATNDMIRQALGKRGVRTGTLRPDVILYGEEHPSADAISRMRCNDLNMKPDLLLVMGTSLKVNGLKMLVREFAQAVHSHRNGRVVFVNMTAPAASVWGDVFDTWVDMDCDSWVMDMRSRRKEIWQAQSQLDSLPVEVRRSRPAASQSKKRKLDKLKDAPSPPRSSSQVRVVIDNDPTTLERSRTKRVKRPATDGILEEEHWQERKSNKRRMPGSASTAQSTLTSTRVLPRSASIAQSTPTSRRALPGSASAAQSTPTSTRVLPGSASTAQPTPTSRRVLPLSQPDQLSPKSTPTTQRKTAEKAPRNSPRTPRQLPTPAATDELKQETPDTIFISSSPPELPVIGTRSLLSSLISHAAVQASPSRGRGRRQSRIQAALRRRRLGRSSGEGGEDEEGERGEGGSFVVHPDGVEPETGSADELGDESRKQASTVLRERRINARIAASEQQQQWAKTRSQE